MDRETVAAICCAFGDLGVSQKLMYWLRDHRALVLWQARASRSPGSREFLCPRSSGWLRPGRASGEARMAPEMRLTVPFRARSSAEVADSANRPRSWRCHEVNSMPGDAVARGWSSCRSSACVTHAETIDCIKSALELTKRPHIRSHLYAVPHRRAGRGQSFAIGSSFQSPRRNRCGGLLSAKCTTDLVR